MAKCKSITDAMGKVTIPAAGLPITCKLKSPPAGVTIAEAEFFPASGGAPAQYTITNGQSFVIPALPAGTKGRLIIRIIGDYPPGTTIYLVEDCDAQNVIIAVVDRFEKAAYANLEVL